MLAAWRESSGGLLTVRFFSFLPFFFVPARPESGTLQTPFFSDILRLRSARWIFFRLWCTRTTVTVRTELHANRGPLARCGLRPRLGRLPFVLASALPIQRRAFGLGRWEIRRSGSRRRLRGRSAFSGQDIHIVPSKTCQRGGGKLASASRSLVCKRVSLG